MPRRNAPVGYVRYGMAARPSCSATTSTMGPMMWLTLDVGGRDMPGSRKRAKLPRHETGPNPPGSRGPPGFGGRFAVARTGPGLVRRVVSRAPGPGCAGAPGRGDLHAFDLLLPMAAKSRTRRLGGPGWPSVVPAFVTTTAPAGVRWLFSRPGGAEHLSQPDTHSAAIGGQTSNPWFWAAPQYPHPGPAGPASATVVFEIHGGSRDLRRSHREDSCERHGR
jgi:hypothetical protein